MNLQFTEITYDHYTPSFEITLVNHDDDPAFNYTFILDVKHIRVKQGHVVKRGDVAHNEGSSNWQPKNLINAIKAALMSVEQSNNLLDAHFGQASVPLQNTLNQLKKCQENWHNFQEQHQRNQFYTANQALQAAINHAMWAGITIKGLDNEDLYPQLEAQYLDHHRNAELNLKNLNNRVETSINESTQRLDASIQELDAHFDTQATDLEFKINDLTTKAEESFKFVGNIKTRIVNELTHEQGELKAKTTEMEEELRTKLDDAHTYFDEKKEAVDTLLEKIEVTSEQLSQLAQAEASSTMVEQFKEASADARSSARWWTFALFLFGCVGVYSFFHLIKKVPTPDAVVGDMGWVTIFSRLSLTATLAYLLGYSGLQATRQRNAKLYFDRMAIEMVSLDAYLSPYDPDTALKIKGDLMEAYFGKVTAPGYQAEGSLPSLDIAKHIAEALAAKAKGAAENAKKDDAKGESNVDLALQLSAKSTPAPKDDTAKEST